MSMAALIIAILGLTATIVVARLVHTSTSKALRRIDALLIAGKSFEEVRTIEGLLEDIVRTGGREGGLFNGKMAHGELIGLSR